MINLENTCVLVKTKEENERLLKEAEKQGFHWHSKNSCEPLQTQHFPDILKFYKGKDITCISYIDPDFTFYEASELLWAKEMTAREFAEWIADMDTSCSDRKCNECVLSEDNTKCNRSFCNINNWEGNIDEILEIAKTGRATVLSLEKKAIETFEKFIENPDRTALNDEFVESLKFAVEKLKEAK